MLFFFLPQVLIFLYLLLRLVLPLRVSRKVRVAAALFLLLASQHFLLRLAFDRMTTPELPGWGIVLEGWCFATVLLLFFLTLARDVFLLLRRLVLGGRRSDRFGGAGRSRRSGRAGGYGGKDAFSPGRRAALLAVLAAGPAAYGVSQAVRLPAVRAWEERSARLPKALDGLGIVHLTDLHVSPLFRRDWVAGLVERVNVLRPDLILLSGDLVDGLPENRLADIAPLADLKARYGVYGCPGNHDYYSGYRFWMARLPELGLRMLQNEHLVLPLRGTELTIAGLTDPAAGRFNLPLPDPRAALAGAPAGSFKILLDHRPTSAAANARAGADLQLCGHTHGGQVAGFNRLVSRFNNGFIYGWYTVGSMRMYVGSGAGLWNGFPLRLGVPSEIAHIVLRRA